MGSSGMYENMKSILYRQYRKISELGIDFGNGGLISLYDPRVRCFAIKDKTVRGDILRESDILIWNEALELQEEREGALDERMYLHLALYQRYPAIRCVVQLDSRWCGIWAQIGGSIPPLSILHAKYFFGEIPCTAPLNERNAISAISDARDLYTAMGRLLLESLAHRAEGQMQAAILRNMGAIVWGNTVEQAVEHAIVLEEVAFRAFQSRLARGDNWEYLPYMLSKEFYFDKDLSGNAHGPFS